MKGWFAVGGIKFGCRKAGNGNPERTTVTASLGEGVFVTKGHGYYYIFASRGRCCAGMNSTYQMVVGRSRNIKGPYLNKEGKSRVEGQRQIVLGKAEENTIEPDGPIQTIGLPHRTEAPCF